MSQASDNVTEPVAISVVAGRYLLFDVNVVTYLRRVHNICGVLTGTLPQAAQQNVFLGLPVELMPEEARLLVEKDAAYIVDEAAWHKEKFSTFEGADKREFLNSLRTTGLNAKKAQEAEARKKTRAALAKQAARGAKKEQSQDFINATGDIENDTAESIFEGEQSSSHVSTSSHPSSDRPYGVTPSFTQRSSKSVQASPKPDLPVISSYPLYSHLHSRDYFCMPGLRFGCDYNVYPGDPLRFHSHFMATSYDWDHKIPMMDLVGGGRLATRVKKGFLFGAEDVEEKEKEGDRVRTFCIEWAGM